MTFPNWLEAVILGLAAWRVWQLLADDDITERARRYVTGLPSTWEEGDRLPDGYRERLAEFINCPYCLGFWVALGWVSAFALWDTGMMWAALPFALNAAVVVVHDWLTTDR